MDEHDILVGFRKKKIMTIEDLMSLFQSSTITVRRRLKKWGAITSINQNGRYYTLPEIPEFDGNGLWKYQIVLFSKYGNLRQTIIELIKSSEAGFSAAELSRIIEIPSNSSYFSQLQRSVEITREKHQGRFVYFTATPSGYERQKSKIAQQDISRWWTDAQAVQILVHMIKNPDIGIERLSIESAPSGKRFAPDAVHNFLKFYGLLKKTPDLSP
ncbi:MAG: hypothetical protein HQK65_19635 [Desulfamplus sp.]|nr:hypothetical protein [Desulfamplus sp.]